MQCPSIPYCLLAQMIYPKHYISNITNLLVMVKIYVTYL